MPTLALGKMKKRRTDAIDTLASLLQDDEVAAHAVMALSRLKAEEARYEILALQKYYWARAVGYLQDCHRA